MEKIMSTFPPSLREQVSAVLSTQVVEEIRLRRNQPVVCITQKGETVLYDYAVTGRDLDFILSRSCEFSLHRIQSQMSQGYFTIKGGHRVGLCGTAVLEGEKIRSFQDISSLSIRIAQEYTGISNGLMSQLQDNGVFQSTLILSPPSLGKTTLLRDMIRHLSDGIGIPSHRVSVVDERSELAGMDMGQANFNLGRNTDILNACPKGIALMYLLRSMNPQILAVDEITAQEDIDALSHVMGCGVTLLATAHGSEEKDLYHRAIYANMMKRKLFNRLIRIERIQQQRDYHVTVLS